MLVVVFLDRAAGGGDGEIILPSESERPSLLLAIFEYTSSLMSRRPKTIVVVLLVLYYSSHRLGHFLRGGISTWLSFQGLAVLLEH